MMKEIQFDCCLCGEENNQKVEIDKNEYKQDIIVKCNSCDKNLSVFVEMKYVVTWLDTAEDE